MKLPNEIFAKILTHLQERGSHSDIKNLKKAIDHPELEGYQQTFDHFTYRSREELCEEGNFICPKCVFSQRDEFNDSIWDLLCRKIFGCHFIQYGGHELVQCRPKRLRPPSKRQSSAMEPSNIHLLQFTYSQELLMKRSRRKSLSQTNQFTVSYLKKIHFSKNCEKTMDAFSKHAISKLKVFKDVDEFLDHLDDCDSHYTYQSLKNILIDDQPEYSPLNYDWLHKSKTLGSSINDLSKPRQVMKKLTSNSILMSGLISLRQPDPGLFDEGSQNTEFLEKILWPILRLAVTLQIEDHLYFPTSQFKSVPDEMHNALAMRDLLRCICEVSENLEYNFEIITWVKAKFATLHGLLEILDSYFNEY